MEQLSAVLAQRLGGDGLAELIGTVSGNINVILKIRYQGLTLGVRLAVNTYRFKYEKTIIKEIFTLYLIHYGHGAVDNPKLRSVIDNILASPVGGPIEHSLVRRVIHYDWSLSTLPWPFFIFEWIDGNILWHQHGESGYFEAGRTLAKLHRIKFDAYYRDIFSIGNEPLSQTVHFARALATERQLAESLLPAVVLSKLDALDPDTLPPTHPCLVHNDYSGGNIIIGADGEQRIIDWDNWVIDAPELDLLKMKYWTAIGPDGLLIAVPALYQAFLQGYTGSADTTINDQRLYAYEVLWLTRAFTFESVHRDHRSHVTSGTALARHYPPARFYQDYLLAL
ncbi:MAG: aminoglycoside phosphotransferase family protein [Rhodospirillaceae bacterium]